MPVSTKAEVGIVIKRLEQGFHAIFADLGRILDHSRGFGACFDGGESFRRAVIAHDQYLGRIHAGIANGLNGPDGRPASGRKERGAVSNPGDLIHVVGGQDHGEALFAQPPHQIHHLPGFTQTQSGRRLIQNDDP